MTNDAKTRAREHERRHVMWLRGHRSVVRVVLSGAALSATTVAALMVFAAWAESHPPAALGPAPVPTTTPSPLPRIEPVVSSDVPWLFLLALAFLVVVGATLRALMTDRSLESARRHVGDVSVVNAKLAVESSRAVAVDAGGTSPRDVYLAARSEALARMAVDLVPHLPTPGESAGDASNRADILLERESNVLAAALQALVAPDTVFSRISERVTLGDERAAVSLARTIERPRPALH